MTPTKHHISRDFGKAALRYDQFATFQRMVTDALFDRITDSIYKDHIVLDCGCGTGYFSTLLKRHHRSATLIQLDLAEDMCRLAASRNKALTIQGDAEDLPLDDATIDHYFSSLVLQWCSLPASLKEIHRVVKPGGQFAFSTLVHGTLHELEAAYRVLGAPPSIQHFLAPSALRTMLDSAGFPQCRIDLHVHTLCYPNVATLLRTMKGIGAQYKSPLPRRYPGKDFFDRLETAYHSRFHTSLGLPATWHVAYVTGVKT